MKKIFLAGLMAAVSLSVMACGGKSGEETTIQAEAAKAEGESPSDGPISFRFAWWGGDERHEATVKAIEAFQAEHPGVTIEPEYGSISGYVEKNSLAIMSGTAADLLQIGSEYVSQYSGNGTNFYDLYQVKDVLDLSQFPQNILEENVVDGKLMAVPVSLTGRVFLFNKTTYDEVGVKIPETLDELYEAGKAFEAYNPDYYPMSLSEYDRQFFITYYLQSKYNRPLISDNQLNYSVEELTEAMEVINKLEENHVIPTIATLAGGMSDSLDKDARWISGCYAGTYEWDSSFTKLRKALEENPDKKGQELVLGEYIKCGDNSGVSTKISMSFAIAATAANPKEIAQFVNFLLNEEEGVEICSTQRGIPCSEAAIKLLNEKRLGDEQVKAANAKVLEHAKFTLDPKFESADLKASPDGVYFKVYGKLSTKDLTTQEAAQTLYDGINECLGN